MKTLLSSDLQTLIDQSAGTCVSLYVPMHVSGIDVQQNPIRIKNQLHDAEKALLAGGMKHDDVKNFLAPAFELTGNDLFWRKHAHGLAMFIAPNIFKYYLLPTTVEPATLVAEHFLMKPLLQLFTNDGRYFILAVSMNVIRLLDATRFTVKEIPIGKIPEGLTDSFREHVQERQLLFHSASPKSSGKEGSAFYGSGPGNDDAKENIVRYFRQVDKALHTHLNGHRAPLVLAGVEYLLPIYREVNTYPLLMDGGVTGSPDQLPAEMLRDHAWSHVENYFGKAREAAANTFRELGAKRTTTDVVNAVTGAMQGKMDSLFVSSTAQSWGTIDAATSAVNVHASQQPHDQDLLDYATVQTIINKGSVFIVEPGQVPGGGNVAAVFRY